MAFCDGNIDEMNLALDAPLTILLMRHQRVQRAQCSRISMEVQVMKKDKDTKPARRVVMVRIDPATYRTLRVLAASMGKDNAGVITQAVALLAAQQEGGA